MKSITFSASYQVILKILVIHLLLSHYSQTVDLIVCPQSTVIPQNCSRLDINQALKSITSDTQITLLPGIHFLSEFILQQNTTGVRIVGLKPSTTVLKCNKTYSGLVFYGVQDLTIENLTIDECGVGRQNNDIIFKSIKSTFRDDLFDFSTLLYQSSIALFLVNCQNVSMTSVIVRNTTGIGLFGINLFGLELEDSTFENNKCGQTSTGSSTGGGVSLLYLDYHNLMPYALYPVPTVTATILNCTFFNNTDCNDKCVSELSNSICRNRYKIGGGGGLTVVLSQLNFSVKVEINSTQFERNNAKVSGGVYASIYSGVDDSSITLSDGLFEHNGELDGATSIAGGMMVSTNLPYPTSLQEQAVCGQGNNTTDYITIVGTNFTSNTANIAGGVYISSLSTESVLISTIHVLVDQCRFEGNYAQRISALAISQESLDKSGLLLQVVLKNSTFTKNCLNLNTQMLYEYSATVGIRSVNITLNGAEFFENDVVALYALRSTIYIVNRVIFSKNSGFGCGGGLKLTDSFLILNNNSAVSFTDNTARVAGGAICVDHTISSLESWRQPNIYGCFVYCTSLESSNCGELYYNATLTFQGNSAASGSTIFGVNVNTECPSLQDILLVNNETTNTPVDRIEILYPREPRMPGEPFDITVVAYDSLNQSVSDIVSYSYSVEVSEECSNGITNDILKYMHNGGGVYPLPNMPSSIPVTINGTGNKMSCAFVFVWSQSSLHFAKFTVHLTKCQLGFMYNASTKTCECDSRLSQVGVKCDRDTVEFTVPSTKWFGPLQHDDKNETTSESKDLLIVHRCPLNYCKPKSTIISSWDVNFQCNEGFNRIGLLCGACKENFSVTLGTSQCKECSNYYLFLIALFILFGVLMVVTMAKLRITISEGFLNSVLFYCNVANYLSADLFPGVDNYWILVLAGVLSIKPKLGLCLFDGMTSLQYFLFQYAFVLYLYLVLGVFLLLVRLKVITTYGPIKLFATLLLFCYGTVAELCTTTLAFVRVQTLNGTVYWGWYIDPTVSYGQGLHLFLCITAIIWMIIYVIPTTFLTLFPQRLYSIRYVSRLKPLYDAVWAPFKPQYRWWFGVRLLLRWVIMIITTFLQFALPSSTFALVIILIVLLYLHTVLSPFQGTWQNRTDSFLLTNLALLIIGALYFQHENISPVPGQIIYSGILVTFAYMVFVGLLLGHLYSRFSVRVKGAFARFKLKWKKGYMLQSIQEDSETPSDEDEAPTQSDASVQVGGESAGELNLWQQESMDPESEELELRSKVVTFSEFREPLLDEGEAELTAFATLKRKVKPSVKK